MKALIGCVLALGLAATASAQTILVSPVTGQPLGRAPDMRGPGFYVYCPDGTWYGPNYCVRPPWAPWGGPVTPQLPCQQSYMRSPRDFFMWSEVMEERIGRERRPALVP